MRKNGDQWSVKVRGIEMTFKLEDDRVYYKHGEDDEWNLSPVHRNEEDIRFSTTPRQRQEIKAGQPSAPPAQPRNDHEKAQAEINRRLDKLKMKQMHGYYRGYAEEKENKKASVVEKVKRKNKSIMETLNITKDQVILTVIGTAIVGLVFLFMYILMNGI